MAKKKKVKPRREFSRRQLSLWQQRKRRQRIVMAVGLSIVVAVLALVGVGWYINEYLPLQEVVISVNDVKFNMDYYIKMLKLYSGGQPASVYYVADEVITVIEQNELIRQEAMKLGISVSQEEVNADLESRDLPLSKHYRDLVRTQMLTDKLRDEYFEQRVPVYAEQRHILAMLLESESQATEIRLRLEGGESFTDLAGEISLQYLSQSENGDLGWNAKEVLAIRLDAPVLIEYAFSSEVGVLSQPVYDEEIMKGVGYWLVKVLERKEDVEEAHVQAILLGSEVEAQEVRARLESGEDFTELAKEISQLEMYGNEEGDLDWLTPGTMGSDFDEFVFNTEIEVGTVSEPIRDAGSDTKGGYWLIKVLDKDDNRQVEDSDRDLLKNRALNEWIEALWDDPNNKVESYLDAEEQLWAVEKAIKDLS